MNPLTQDDLLAVLENTTLAQLRALRALRRADHRRPPEADPKRPSNMEVVYQVLLAAKGPLHIEDILQRAQKDHRRSLHRESIVSALTKKVLDQNVFTRTAPNTFDLRNRPA